MQFPVITYGKALYSAYQKKKVIHFQRPIVLKSINLNIYMWHTSKEQLILIGIIFASWMSCMTEYIAIEDDSVISHLLQV